MINIFFKNKVIILVILIVSIICLLYFMNFKEKEDYNGIFVKVGDNVGYIYKTV